jgi:hypothetical protein
VGYRIRPEDILDDEELIERTRAECQAQGISMAIPAHALGPIARLLRSKPGASEADAAGEIDERAE